MLNIIYFNNNFVNFVKISTHIDLIKINTLLAKIILKLIGKKNEK